LKLSKTLNSQGAVIAEYIQNGRTRLANKLYPFEVNEEDLLSNTEIKFIDDVKIIS